MYKLFKFDLLLIAISEHFSSAFNGQFLIQLWVKKLACSPMKYNGLD